MIPRLETAPHAPSPSAAFLCHLAGTGFEGDIAMSATEHTIFSTDNFVDPAVVAGCEAPEVLHSVEASLDAIAVFVDDFIVGDGDISRTV